MLSKNSISIGSQSTNGISGKTDLGFELPAPNNPRKTCFQKTRFLLVPSRPTKKRGQTHKQTVNFGIETLTTVKGIFKMFFYLKTISTLNLDNNKIDRRGVDYLYKELENNTVCFCFL
jgi:hypothetical protein